MTKETTTMLLTLVFMAIGILYQVAIGVIYQRMIQQADTLSETDNKLLKQCKERFINCYKLNGGVSNIPVFVDKYINRIRVLGMSINFMKHLSGQLMLAGVFVAGFGVFSGIVEGHRFVDLLPYYIISLFGIYLYLSAMSIVDMPGRRRMLKTNLTDYLENTVAQRLEHGIVEKEKLLWELEQEKSAKAEKRSKPEIRAAEEESKQESAAPDFDTDSDKEKKAPVFSQEEAHELEEILRTIIGNRV